MFKTFATAAAFALAAAASQAATSTEIDLGLPSATVQTEETFETAYYCEWVTVYDYYGNWATVWQCY